MDDLRKRLATALGRRIPFVRPDYDLNLRRDVELGLADAALAIIEPELAAIRQSTLEAVREKAAAVLEKRNLFVLAEAMGKLELGE
ncbi:MAG: hypothetical protein WDN46_04925 [Methylocella sp.]